MNSTDTTVDTPKVKWGQPGIINAARKSGLPPGTPQHDLSLGAPVMPAAVDKLNALLQQLRADLEAGQTPPYAVLGTIHYLRLVLLPAEQGTPGAAPKLVFATDYDGDEAAHLRGLCDTCAAFMDSLFEHCEGWPTPGTRTPDARIAYLQQYRIKSAAFFVGAPGRTLHQIRQESELHDFVWEFVHNGKWAGKTAVQVHKAVKEAVLAQPEFQWVKDKAPLPHLNIPRLLVMVVCVLALLPFIVLWIIILQLFHERKDKQLGLTPSQVDSKHTGRLEEYEDFHNQNQFTQLLIMKPGFMRLKTVQGMMLLTRTLGGSFFVHGELMGIPTIHFARWQMIDSNRRMLFFSNFDGSWQQYLGDFIDKSGWGLTGIWSNTINFPRAHFLFTGGAYDAEHFLAWSRHYQIPTAVWYCAYPNLSIKNVMTNTLIRNAMVQDLTEVKAQKFLNSI